MSGTREYLEAKLAAAAELYEQGDISRVECLRHEVDIAVQKDSGPIKLIAPPPSTNPER